MNPANLDKVQQTLTSMNQRGKGAGSGSLGMEGGGGASHQSSSSSSSSSSGSQSQRSQQDDHTHANISIDVAAGSWQTTNGSNMAPTTVRDSAEFSTTSETEMVVEKDLTGQFRDVARSFQSQESNHSRGGVGRGGVGVLGEGEEKKNSQPQRSVGVAGDDKSDDDDLDDDRGLESLPGTYEEIYEISNRNRKRNKEKKRQRDGDDGDEAADVPQVAVASKGGTKPGKTGTAVSTNQSRTASSSSFSSSANKASDTEFKRMGDRLFDESIYFAHASMQSGGDAAGGGIFIVIYCHLLSQSYIVTYCHSCRPLLLPNSHTLLSTRAHPLIPHHNHTITKHTLIPLIPVFPPSLPGTAADMEGTLDFAEKVGWMAKSDRQATKDAHLEEQMAHADSHQVITSSPSLPPHPAPLSQAPSPFSRRVLIVHPHNPLLITTPLSSYPPPSHPTTPHQVRYVNVSYFILTF